MVVIDLANEMDWLSSSSDIVELNSTMSDFIKLDLFFCGSKNVIVSKCVLQTSPDSFFAGLIKLHLVLFQKFDL